MTTFKDKLNDKYKAFKKKLTNIFYDSYRYSTGTEYELKAGWLAFFIIFGTFLAILLIVVGIIRYEAKNVEDTWQHNREINHVITVSCDHRMVQMNFDSEGHDTVCMSSPESVRRYQAYYVGYSERRGNYFYIIDRSHNVIEFINENCTITSTNNNSNNNN